MALTSVNTTLENTSRRLVVACNLVVDGVAGTDVILVDKSAFVGPDGTEPGRLVVEKIEWSLDGLSCELEFEHTADDPIANLAGQGTIDFYQDGKYQGFVDPASAGGTGDIIVTSTNDTAGDNGVIILYLRKKD